MKKLFLLNVLILFSIVANSQANFSIEKTLLKPGETKTVTIMMDVLSNVKAFQFDVYLPEEMSFVDGSASLTEWGNKHTLSAKINNAGFYRMMVMTFQNGIFEPAKKAIITFDVKVADNASLGDKNMYIKNAVVTPESGTKQKIDEIPCLVTIYQTYSVSAITADDKMGTVEINGGDEIKNGTKITAIAKPEPGYEFVNWTSEDAEVSKDSIYIFEVYGNIKLIANFKAINYDVIFDVDGEKSVNSLAYGTVIDKPNDPQKEGYTFDGWLPAFVEGATVPVDGVTYTAQWKVNQYTVKYVVDGVVVKEEKYDYGASITPLEAPTKEGHTFNGWSELPSTMPAKDISVIGKFTVNVYNVIYLVNEIEIHRDKVEYGAVIPLYEYESTAESFIFNGWIGEKYETMPAHDVIYRADVTTGIDELVVKEMQNKIYTIQGIHLDSKHKHLQHGVYIINGKKVIIK